MLFSHILSSFFYYNLKKEYMTNSYVLKHGTFEPWIDFLHASIVQKTHYDQTCMWIIQNLDDN